jgi:predicted nucleic acid-binding protein
MPIRNWSRCWKPLEVGCHAHVIEELALGSIKQRRKFLELLGNLRRFPLVTHVEVMALIERRRLWARGLSAVDAHLLGSVSPVAGAQLWTRDKQLIPACGDVGVAYVENA